MERSVPPELPGQNGLDEEPMHRSAEDTRAGSTPHIVRYILGISLLLALVAMTVVYLWGGS